MWVAARHRPTHHGEVCLERGPNVYRAQDTEVFFLQGPGDLLDSFVLWHVLQMSPKNVSTLLPYPTHRCLLGLFYFMFSLRASARW